MAETFGILAKALHCVAVYMAVTYLMAAVFYGEDAFCHFQIWLQ